jgi:hypothetical protein
MATLTKEQIIARETSVYDQAVEAKRDPVWAVAQDRAKRYRRYVAGLQVPPEIQEWADAMTAKCARLAVAPTLDNDGQDAFDGKTVRIHNNTVDWVTALLIVRYGEAEYHWPEDGTFTTEDVARAKEWLNNPGKLPEGVVYL